MSVYQQLREHWTSLGVELADPASAKDIWEFERRCGVPWPESFRQYLLIAGGMNDGATDEELIGFLSLPAIERESAARDIPAGTIVFAEYLIWSHWYVIRVGDGAVLAGDGQHQQRVADSFEDFLEQYLADPAAIANYWKTSEISSS